MLRKKIRTLINRYDKRTDKLGDPRRDLKSERFTVSQGELYEYRFIISQLIRALDSSTNDYALTSLLVEIIRKEEHRESSFKASASAHSDYTVAPDHEGRARACFKIIQDLKGILSKHKKPKITIAPPSPIRNIVVCKG
jgi:hypothetical protein